MLQNVRAQMLSHVQLFVTPWTVACQAPLSMGFPRQGYWSGLPFPPPRDLPDPGIGPTYPVLPALQAESSEDTRVSWCEQSIAAKLIASAQLANRCLHFHICF